MISRQVGLLSMLPIGAAFVSLSSGCRSTAVTNPPVASAQQHVDIKLSGFGHYCSILNNDGSWAFEFDPAGGDPCGNVRESAIKRAGIYKGGSEDRPNENNLVVRCEGGYLKTYPDQQYAKVNDTTLAQIRTDTQNQNLPGCIFTMAPKRLPIFETPIPAHPFGASYGFDFTRPPYLFGQTNCPNAFFATITNYAGQDRSCATNARDDSDGYFWEANVGLSLYAAAEGVVLKSRFKKTPCCNSDSQEQGELYIAHSVMSGSTDDPNYERYIEKFVTAYYYIHSSLVTAGQTVTPADGNGQRITIASSGNNGCAPFNGVHFSVYRLTNTANNYRATLNIYNSENENSNNGYKIAIDPFGFSGSSFDPWAYLSYSEEMGALSIDLWKSNQAPNRGSW